MTAVADLAAAEFEDRLKRARELVAAGKVAAEAANQALLPWLAIAARAGADLPQLYETITLIWPFGEQRQRRMVHWQVCAPEVWQTELRKVCDQAAQRSAANPAARDHSDRIQRIAFELLRYVPALPAMQAAA